MDRDEWQRRFREGFSKTGDMQKKEEEKGEGFFKKLKDRIIGNETAGEKMGKSFKNYFDKKRK